MPFQVSESLGREREMDCHPISSRWPMIAAAFLRVKQSGAPNLCFTFSMSLPSSNYFEKLSSSCLLNIYLPKSFIELALPPCVPGSFGHASVAAPVL